MCMYPANAVPSCAAGAHWALPACVHAGDDVHGPRSRPDGKPHDQPSTTPRFRLALSYLSPRAANVVCARSLGIGYVRVARRAWVRGESFPYSCHSRCAYMDRSHTFTHITRPRGLRAARPQGKVIRI